MTPEKDYDLPDFTHKPVSYGYCKQQHDAAKAEVDKTFDSLKTTLMWALGIIVVVLLAAFGFTYTTTNAISHDQAVLQQHTAQVAEDLKLNDANRSGQVRTLIDTNKAILEALTGKATDKDVAKK